LKCETNADEGRCGSDSNVGVRDLNPMTTMTNMLEKYSVYKSLLGGKSMKIAGESNHIVR
jgi:hypothetical protein